MMDYAGRLRKLRRYLAGKTLSACIVIGEPNIFYLTGLREVSGALIVSRTEACFLVPALYYTEALDKSAAVRRLVAVEETKPDRVRKLLSGFRSVGFISSEVTFATWERWSKQYSCKLVSLPDFIRELRAVKEPEEQVLIKKSLAVARQVMRETIRQVKPGAEELDIV